MRVRHFRLHGLGGRRFPGAPIDEFTERVVDPSATGTGAALTQVDPVEVSFDDGVDRSPRIAKLTSGVHHSFAVRGALACVSTCLCACMGLPRVVNSS